MIFWRIDWKIKSKWIWIKLINFCEYIFAFLWSGSKPIYIFRELYRIQNYNFI